ncbi:MAG: hydroxymethylbilane synthase [Chitinophagales bacterium]
MLKPIRIGTRESPLAVWQASQVLKGLQDQGIGAELVPIASEGDLDLTTPLYEMGVQGVFTRSLDIALLNHRVDLAVHSMKDVPTQLAEGIVQAAVLKRGSYKDVLIYQGDWSSVSPEVPIPNPLGQRSVTPDRGPFTIATSSIRRKAQWLNRYPDHIIENLRGNVSTRLRKLEESQWSGAIFAAAGIERLNLRPARAIDLDWMLPAPAQGAIMIVCRLMDNDALEACRPLSDAAAEICTKIERDFLRSLLGGCSTPISALAELEKDEIYFRGNILSPDGHHKAEIEKVLPLERAANLGMQAAKEILERGAREITEIIRNA